MEIRLNTALNNHNIRRHQLLNTNINKTNVINNKNITQLSDFNPAYITNISFSGKNQKQDFELNLSHEELVKRTKPEHLKAYKLLDVDSPEYLALDENDKKALSHLVKAAFIVEKVNKQLDNPHNLDFEEYLNSEIKKGNKDAELTKVLYDGQKGIFASDVEANKIELAKGLKELPQKGYYPEDLTVDEFHSILKKMLNEGKSKEVKNILNQRTVVERKDDKLIGIDYTEKFKDEFSQMANELEEAAKVSTNDDFNEYLLLQAKALRTIDPMLDAYADKKWASLQDTPLEFTISRENYEDEMTPSISENKELSEMLEERGITPIPKDALGGRVGIVNKEGTDFLTHAKDFLPVMAENMPFLDEYEQNISKNSDFKQTMVDVDIVALTGDEGQYRAGITVAENLPNDDKLSLTIGGGRRNVYHRQIRMNNLADSAKQLLTPSQQKYFSGNANHQFTIGHENAHSLGPVVQNSNLGKYKSILEENKADMASIAMLDVLVENGIYTEEDKKKIMTTFAAKNMLKNKPNLSQAHRVRSVMQTNYLMKEGAIQIDKNGVMTVDFDKMSEASYKMLKDIIRIQIDNDFDKAEKFVNDNFIWTKEMETVAERRKSLDKKLNGKLENPLADSLFAE